MKELKNVCTRLFVIFALHFQISEQMKRYLKISLTILLASTGTLNSYAQHEADRLSLDGTWQLRQQGSTKTYNAKVPGVVHVDLLKNRVIADPFYATYEEKL